LLTTAKADHTMLNHGFGVADTKGKVSKLSLWNHPGEDIYGMIARCRRVVDSVEQLLGGEVYHYHSKMMLKEPKVGGAWEWHQDYGYWYHNVCVYPLLASCLVAVTAATKENRCLQVVPGSHHLGRLDHGKTGEQTGAHQEHVDAVFQRLPSRHRRNRRADRG